MAAGRIAIEAPASTANLGPGFDIFGMALGGMKDRVKIVLSGDGLRLTMARECNISENVTVNSAGLVAMSMIRDFDLPHDMNIEIEKGVPVGVGLGSSAASAAAVAYGINELFTLRLDHNRLIAYAAKGELASAGVEHADNVSASLLGGFIMIRSYYPLDVLRMEPPPHLGMCIAIPIMERVEKKTEKFRSVVPETISLKDAIRNMGNCSSMVLAMVNGDVALLGRSMEDAIAESRRAPLIPGCGEVKKLAMEAGSSGVAISGAGPSMISFFDVRHANLEAIGKAMVEGFASAGLKASYMQTHPDEGARIVGD